MRDRTLIVFHSDNGGPRRAKFTGEVDMSKSTIPADNGPYRDGKGTLYEGGTRVAALVNWPGRVNAGSVVDQRIHVVDMYPTLAKLAGALPAKEKPLDGIDVWPAIGEGRPSPREEVVYAIEPFRAALSKGDWKLVWYPTLPSRIELFNLGENRSEKVDLSEKNPQKVAELKQRIEILSREAVTPLILTEALGAVKPALFGSVSFPEEEKELEMQP
jgi:arylsulfatase A-like enzyme